MSKRRVVALSLAAITALLVLIVCFVAWLNLREDGDDSQGSNSAGDATRGAYLLRAGNCEGCHTAAGGEAYAGGRAIETPFGSVVSSNLTPDDRTGLGRWTSDDFWRALHYGRAKGGRLLYPAFPYPNYTRVSRPDADAMFAALRSLPAASHENAPHSLTFPFNTQAALAIWRALFFKASGYSVDPARPAAWNRGAYLVEGLGHCNACHSARNAFGATRGPIDLQGGLIPVQNWYAPSLASSREAGVAAWPTAEITRLLATGIASHGFVMGPMREVVGNSLQYLSAADLESMASYLQSLPSPHEEPPTTTAQAVAGVGRGAALYRDHCAGCHGGNGEGRADAYPALAGSRAVTMQSLANLVHIVREGGFPPSTRANPRPFGMPPFANELNSDEMAELLTFVRTSWGNAAPPVSALAVEQTLHGR